MANDLLVMRRRLPKVTIVPCSGCRVISFEGGILRAWFILVELIFQFDGLPYEGAVHLGAADIDQVSDLEFVVKAYAVRYTVTVEDGDGCSIHGNAEDSNADTGYDTVDRTL